ncbi:MAG TPA: methyl-coenzyme M reductase operon protein D [Candidatus Methanoculleus thermohydrogenotrophicum]|jgi:methyl-coenzyme M reductase subunit D|nr:methyl-coenzyme M reductase operon protein D [Candidatus Methanoculleus thermohydrogenotrophicum]NLM82105.1 methyl-coenzyme M reductase operon protein D [Candidatus Methanoculleus thermohydrogenotrophicum]HOB18313.1 methyl-coenzyme M reductase operon protein D [Candidatus Methanoculleus thermohydrogenotrophicum]HPZ38072.1 methyl-coenzyme M reductase operon protein D [Candidatus Methanoculleus thermohydrogenotrophicum]HQC91497.1 methyl-coenzyme M reductase operon protein D [Candidatus Methano
MTDAIYPQVRIVPMRLLRPDTAEQLLNKLIQVGGIRRMTINGPNLPATVPYGPARGEPNPHPDRRAIRVGDQDVMLQIQVGMVILELEDESYIPAVKKAADETFADKGFSCTVQQGRYMKTQPTLSDYAKYGPDADRELLGLVDPRKKDRPIIIQGTK